MPVLDTNTLIQNYVLQSGLLNNQGQLQGPQQARPQEPGLKGLLNSPGFAQALSTLGTSISMANAKGLDIGTALSLGMGNFANTLQAEKDRIEQVERQATQDRLASLKDIIGLKTQQEELGLRMQAASLARRAQQDAIDSRAQERQREAQQMAALTEMAQKDPRIATALQVGGLSAARELAIGGLTQTGPDTKGLPAGYMWGPDKQTAIPIPGVVETTKTTDTARKERDLAVEGLDALKDAESALYDKDGSLNRWAVNMGSMSSSGRDIKQPLATAIGNNIYLKTGAAATPGEIDAMMEQYAPSALDTKAQVQRKLASLQSFLQSKAPDYQATGKATRPNAAGGFKYLGAE